MLELSPFVSCKDIYIRQIHFQQLKCTCIFYFVRVLADLSSLKKAKDVNNAGIVNFKGIPPVVFGVKENEI